jgi:hypothetical protein
VHGPADGLAEDGPDGPCDVFFCSFFSLLLFWPCIIGLYFYIFLFLHISKASPYLTAYHLKGKKVVRHLELPYRLKKYVSRVLTFRVRLIGDGFQKMTLWSKVLY